MTEHLGHITNASVANTAGNARNGKSKKTLKGAFSELPIDIPRDTGVVRAKAVYLALGINMAGEKEILGLWIAQTEGAKFWMQVIAELKNRRMADIFIACVDGLMGFPEAIEAVYPQTAVQLYLVHMVRHSLNYVSWKMRKVTKRRGAFPSDEALLKLFYLALNNISKKWTMQLRDWKAALTRFTIQFEGRVPKD